MKKFFKLAEYKLKKKHVQLPICLTIGIGKRSVHRHTTL